jgi:glyoxylase-like metal-dependent hydrolase (beta-lactamase superfamily II)
LEGLEIREILLSEPLNTELLRLESEFYTAKTFTLNKSYSGLDVIDFVQYGTSDELNEEKEYKIDKFNFNVIFNPGHSSDSISFYFKKENILFCGDFIFYESIGRCDLPTGDYKITDRSHD